MCIFICIPVTRRHEVGRNKDFDSVAAHMYIHIPMYMYTCIHICIYSYTHL